MKLFKYSARPAYVYSARFFRHSERPSGNQQGLRSQIMIAAIVISYTRLPHADTPTTSTATTTTTTTTSTATTTLTPTTTTISATTHISKTYYVDLERYKTSVRKW